MPFGLMLQVWCSCGPAVPSVVSTFHLMRMRVMKMMIPCWCWLGVFGGQIVLHFGSCSEWFLVPRPSLRHVSSVRIQFFSAELLWVSLLQLSQLLQETLEREVVVHCFSFDNRDWTNPAKKARWTIKVEDVRMLMMLQNLAMEVRCHHPRVDTLLSWSPVHPLPLFRSVSMLICCQSADHRCFFFRIFCPSRVPWSGYEIDVVRCPPNPREGLVESWSPVERPVWQIGAQLCVIWTEISEIYEPPKRGVMGGWEALRRVRLVSTSAGFLLIKTAWAEEVPVTTPRDFYRRYVSRIFGK